MTVQTYKMGPGTLTLGAGALEVSGQITNCRVEAAENVTASEAIPVLSGEELAAEESATYRFSLAGSLLQDIVAAGVVDWSWANRGTTQPFTFVPSTAAGRQVTGFVRPIPLTVGGDVSKTASPTADFSWAIVGDPDLGDTA